MTKATLVNPWVAGEEKNTKEHKITFTSDGYIYHYMVIFS